MPPGPPGKEERATLFLPLLLLSGLFCLFLELLVGFSQVEGWQVGYGFGPSGKTALWAGFVLVGKGLAAALAFGGGNHLPTLPLELDLLSELGPSALDIRLGQVGYGFGAGVQAALRAGFVIAGARLAAIPTLCHEVSSRFIQGAQANLSHW